MDKNLVKIEENFNLVEPPAGLFDRIMCRIEREKRFITLRRRIIIFSVGLIGSAVAFVPALNFLRADLAESGFMTFFSLIFSDTKVVMAYWQNFGQSLLEALPVTGLAAVLLSTVVFLESLKLLAKDIKNIYVSKLRKA